MPTVTGPDMYADIVRVHTSGLRPELSKTVLPVKVPDIFDENQSLKILSNKQTIEIIFIFFFLFNE